MAGVGQVNTQVPGVYRVSYDYKDQAGNSAITVIREIIVEDTIAPIVSLTGDANITIEAGSDYVDAGASWTDAVDGNGTLIGHGEVNHLVPGIYSINYHWNDLAGNYANAVKRTVTVKDTMPPMIILDGNDTIVHPVWEEFLEPGYQAYDTVDGNVTSKVAVAGTVNNLVPGNYLLEYRVSDESGNSAITRIRTVKVVNRAPKDILLSNNKVSENLNDEFIVGTFKTIDDDDPGGIKNYSYQILPNETGESSPFVVEENGTLKTTRPLDWEAQQQYSITVQSVDEFGGVLDKNFTLLIKDLFRPILRTVEKFERINDKYQFSGEILDLGGHDSVEECGIIVSSHPNPYMEDEDLIRIVSENTEAGKYSVIFNPEKSLPRKFYFRAYASNGEGLSYGWSVKVKVDTEEPGSKVFAKWFDANSMAVGKNWWQSEWFGIFYANQPNGWIMHEHLGWVYAFPSSNNGFWLWADGMSWMWSRRDLYPYLFSQEKSSWLFFYGGAGGEILFYDYESNQWIQTGKPEEL